MPPEGTPSATFIIKGPFIIDGLATQFSAELGAGLSWNPPTDRQYRELFRYLLEVRTERRMNRIASLVECEYASANFACPTYRAVCS